MDAGKVARIWGAVGGGMFCVLGFFWLGKTVRDDDRQRLVDADARAAQLVEQSRTARQLAARQRRAVPLERVHVAIHETGMFQGISVCPSSPLTNCEVFLGIRDGTLRWRTPRIAVPARCENLPMHASVSCTVDDMRADAFVPTDWSCRMSRGYFGSNVNAFAVVDLREPQLTNRRVVVQCDEGRSEGTFEESPEDPR